MTNYYLNLPVINPRLAELLKLMPDERKPGVRLRYIKNAIESFNLACLVWPILPDETHPILESDDGKKIINVDDQLSFVGRHDDEGAFYPLVYLSSDTAVANGYDVMITRGDMLANFQAGNNKLGGFNFVLPDGQIKRIEEREIATLKLLPLPNTNTTVPKREPMPKGEERSFKTKDLENLRAIKRIFELENDKQRVQDEAYKTATKQTHNVALAVVSGLLSVVLLIVAVQHGQTNLLGYGGVAGLAAIVLFATRKGELTSMYNKLLTTGKYANQIQEIEALQTDLGNYDSELINFVPEYLRNLPDVAELVGYMERGQAHDLPEAIQLYEQN